MMAKGLAALRAVLEVMVRVVVDMEMFAFAFALCGEKANEIERRESEIRLMKERMLFITILYRMEL